MGEDRVREARQEGREGGREGGGDVMLAVRRERADNVGHNAGYSVCVHSSHRRGREGGRCDHCRVGMECLLPL